MTTTAIETPATLAEVMACNAAHGYHFFEPDTMRFFKSRILSDVFPSACGGFVVFVTSERDGDNARRYSVRALIVSTGNVETVGGFQRYASRTGAVGAARRFSSAGWTLNPEPWESQHKCNAQASSGGPCWRGAQFLRTGHAGSCAEHATAWHPPGAALPGGSHTSPKEDHTMARSTIYQGKVLPLADAKAAYAAIDALQGQVWEELVTVRDMAQSVLSRINEAKAHALADVVASQKAELATK